MLTTQRVQTPNEDIYLKFYRDPYSELIKVCSLFNLKGMKGSLGILLVLLFGLLSSLLLSYCSPVF